MREFEDCAEGFCDEFGALAEILEGAVGAPAWGVGEEGVDEGDLGGWGEIWGNLRDAVWDDKG